MNPTEESSGLWSQMKQEDVFRNILLQMNPRDIKNLVEAEGTTKIKSILEDQSYWSERFKNTYPVLYGALFSSHYENFDWKEALKQADFFFRHNDISGVKSPYINDNLTSIRVRAAIIKSRLVPLDKLGRWYEDDFDPDLREIYQEILNIFLENPDAEYPVLFLDGVEKIAINMCDTKALAELLKLEYIKKSTIHPAVLDFVRCVGILDLYAPYFKDIKKVLIRPLIRSAKSIEEFQDFIDEYQLELPPNSILWAAEHNPLIFNYLVDAYHNDRFYNCKDISICKNDSTLHYAISGGQYELLNELLSYNQSVNYLNTKILEFACAIPGFDSDFFVSHIEYLTALRGKFECARILISFPECDNILNVNSLLRIYTPNERYHNTSHMKPTNRNILLGIFDDFYNLLTHRLDADMNEEDLLRSWEIYTPIFKKCLLDTRVNLDNLRRKIGNYSDITTRLLLTMLQEAEDERSNMKLSIRNIHPINNLTSTEKLKAMKVLLRENKLDDLTSKLIQNDEFVRIYSMTPASIAKILNERGIPVFNHVNSAAAAAFLANDLDAFRALVPFSTQASMLENEIQ